jgi:hypothetical protein
VSALAHATDSVASPSLVDALDYVRLGEIAELAEHAASYWISIREAAERGERLTVETHCRQVRLVTLAAFETVKSLGSEAAEL